MLIHGFVELVVADHRAVTASVLKSRRYGALASNLYRISLGEFLIVLNVVNF